MPVDVEKYPFVTILFEFKFSNDSLTDLSFCIHLHFQCCRLKLYASRRRIWKIFFIDMYAYGNQTQVEQLNVFAI